MFLVHLLSEMGFAAWAQNIWVVTGRTSTF